jgi:DNA-directed RNA polymerase specialized sigma24 family protein
MENWNLTEEDFNFFLNWLSPEPQEAGRKFEALRRRLITFFDVRCCSDAEGLADQTIDRVMRKLPSLSADLLSSFASETTSLKNPQAAYCYRFAHYVHLEYLKKLASEGGELDENHYAAVSADETKRKELRADCLDRCLKTLPPQKRRLLMLYFEKEKQAKVEHHQWLAGHFGYSINALRLQIHRLTHKMHDCISACQANQ